MSVEGRTVDDADRFTCTVGDLNEFSVSTLPLRSVIHGIPGFLLENRSYGSNNVLVVQHGLRHLLY